MKLVMKATDIDGVNYTIHNPSANISEEARHIIRMGYVEIAAPKNRVAILFSKFIVSLFNEEVKGSREF